MGIVQIVIIGLISTIIGIIIKENNKEFATYIRIAVGIVLFFLIFSKLSTVMSMITNIVEKTNIPSVYIKILFKIVGIAYLAEFGSEICKDAGENSIASKIEFSGKVLIMLISTPIIVALIEEISKVLT